MCGRVSDDSSTHVVGGGHDWNRVFDDVDAEGQASLVDIRGNAL